MFVHYVRYRVLIFIIFTLCCKVSESNKPIISPNQEEIVLNEGEFLEITCTGTAPLKFVYPDTLNKDVFNTSTPEIIQNEKNGVYKYIFQRPKTIFGDTGWYGCADYNVEIPDSFDNSEVNWLYVYVKSNTNLFVEAETFSHLNAVVGDSIIIPCRPTSPDLVLELRNTNGEELEGKMISFDPRIGYTMKNLTVKDSDWYRCVIQKDEEEIEINYILSVSLQQNLPNPKIHDDTLRHVTRGQDLYVNCTIEIDASVRYVFNWSIPQNDSRVSTQEFRKKLDGNYLLVTCQLTIFNVTDEDAGEYKCIFRSTHEVTNTTKNITIYDPQIKYINLTSQHSERYYQGEKGGNVQWVVYVDGFPRPHLQWFEPKGQEITPSQKYFVNTSTTITILRINNLAITDAGDYILEAKNDYTMKKLNFTLDIIGKPTVLLGEIESYYAPNETAEFRCEILSHPTANVTWDFVKYPNYPSSENSTIVKLTDVMENAYSTYKYESRAKMLIEVSGKLTCKACNSFDCDAVTENIFVSDGIGAFGIIGPKELVTKDDTVELICAASVYNYTDDLTWTKLENETETPVIETNRLEIIHNKTPFTYRSTLKIHHVQESDAQNYICTGKYINGLSYVDLSNPVLSDYASYKLIIHDPVSPFFTKTNMNETIVKNIDVIAEGHKTVILQCFADGMPKPKITWYKDNVLLVENDQYLFKFNYQELNIKYFKEYDSGRYSCRAINRLGTNKTYQEIMVKNAKLQKLDVILAVSIAILGITLVILAIFFTIKVRREKKMRKELMEAGLMHFEEGALECLNPDLTVDDQAELLPYDKKWEFPRERLKLGKQLGSGAFGVVIKAEAQGICENETVTTVAVKMVRRTTDPTYVRALASELKIMVHLGKHLNVVNLLGACTKNISKRELLVIVEYCRFGNLHNYLLKHRSNFINQIDPNTGKLDLTIGVDILTRTTSISSNNRIKYAALSFSRSISANSGTDTVVHYCPGTTSDTQEINFSPDGCVLSNNSFQPDWRTNYRGDYKDQNLKPICTQDLLSYAFQVARGMEYLSQRRVLHGDLAARNILLCENNIVKICDFGLAKTMYKDDNYKKKGDGPLPIKWMAIESIRDRIFSTQSDIWSFGIVLWEFFTLSETPYPSMEAEKLYQKLIEGYRMEQPEYAIREIYEIMSQCWKAKPTLRPSFTDLVESIGNLLEESVKSHYISLNTPYMDMNTMILESGKNDYLTMMSAPDHGALSSPGHYANSPFSEGAPDSSYLCMSPNCQTNESGIFSPRPHEDRSHFEFPSPASDSEDAVELSPMLKHEEDPYLKPINVQERRAEFARQREAMKNKMTERSIDRDSGYCNAPRNLHLIDLNDMDENDAAHRADADSKKDYVPPIISTQDNYVNMPKQKSDLRLGVPDGFSNPSYVMMNTREMDQRV